MKNKKEHIQENIEEGTVDVTIHEVPETVKLKFNIENEFPPVVEPEGNIISQDPIRWKVEALRLQGFDDNRIAAMLMIHKHIVEGIK